MTNTTKETRRDSIDTINETLGHRHMLILNQLRFIDDTTARELAISMYEQGLIATPDRNMVHPRLNELVEKDLVEVIGKRKDELMNRMVAVYKIK